MLNDKDIVATIAVRDLTAARRFYEDALGLEPVDSESQEVIVYRSGRSNVLVYRSEYAGTNKATTATWIVGDEVDEIVKTLRGRGVAFEHYKFPNSRLEGDVHIMGELRNAWFKDPDGNILSVVNGRRAESRVGAER